MAGSLQQHGNEDPSDLERLLDEKNADYLLAIAMVKGRLREEQRDYKEYEKLLRTLIYLCLNVANDAFPKLHHLLRTKHRSGVITRIDKTSFTHIEEMLQCLEYDLYADKAKYLCEDCRIHSKPTLIFRGTYLEKCEREIREFEKSLRAGNTPIFRSQPYEEMNKRIIKNRYLDRQILWQNKHTIARNNKNTCNRGKSKGTHGHE